MGGSSLTRSGTDSQTRRRPGRPRHRATDDAIIRAALDLLAERGFQGATIEGIADRAGVGRNTIYRRWASKEELVADALRGVTIDFAELKAEALHDMLLIWIRDFASTISDPLYGRLLSGVLGELQRNPVFARVYAERVVEPRRTALLERLAEARDCGEIRAETNIELVADIVGGPLILHVLPLGLPAVGDRYPEQLVETIWSGIAPPKRRSSDGARPTT